MIFDVDTFLKDVLLKNKDIQSKSILKEYVEDNDIYSKSILRYDK